MTCAGCQMPLEEWTPGCRTCTSRHYKRAIRSGDDRLLATHHAIGREHREWGVMEQARRTRAGEIVRVLPPRGDRGRWVNA
jgi:hypothetical protein